MSYAPYAGGGQPSFVGSWNPWAMYQPPNFEDPQQTIGQDLSGNASSMPALQQFDKEATRQGPSAWSNLAQGQQDKFATDAQSKAAGTAAGNAAGAQSQLAMRGGLDSGARQQIARNQGRDYMNMTQNVENTRANNGMQIGMNDEQNRIQQLGMVPQMTNQANQQNFQRAGMDMQANQFQNAWNMGKYHESMAGAGAQATSQATANSGGSSFICSALRRKGLMSTREAVIMTRFMLRAVPTRADFCLWYFTKGQKAVEMAERQKYDFSVIKARYVDDIIETLRDHGDEAAQDLYIKRAGQFVRQWLGADAKYNPELEKKNVVASLMALPFLFCLPTTWRWLKGFYGAKISKSFKLKWRTI